MHLGGESRNPASPPPVNVLGGRDYNTQSIIELLEENRFTVKRMTTPRSFVDKPLFLLGLMMRDHFYITYATRILTFARYVSRPKNIICHIVGSDALVLGEHMDELQLAMKRHSVRLLYASESLRDELRIEGDVAPIPVKEWLFTPEGDRFWKEKRDTLFYCPDPYIYSAWDVDEYIRDHRDEQITVLGMQPDVPSIPDYPNVLRLSLVPSGEMPRVYRSHKRLIRITRHDGMPKMIYEAFLCGCEVWWNGKQITSVPDSMRWREGGRLIAQKVIEHFEG